MQPLYTYITINTGYSHNKALWVFVAGARQEMAAVSIQEPAEKRRPDPVSVSYWIL